MSAAVDAARARRDPTADASMDEWFIDVVMMKVLLSFEQRMKLAVEYLKNKVVKNISKPVVKTVVGGRTRITGRSKAGEFPRADTTLLMKSVIGDVKRIGDNTIDGYVGTPVSYGVILELKKDRSFLRRTFAEQHSKMVKIMSGPPPL